MSASKEAPGVLPDWFETLTLKAGAHSTREQGLCVMEAAAFLAGRKHSDAPPCVSPVIGAFLRTWNDNLPDDETRTRLLKPLLPVILGTTSTPEIEERRSYMALDWFIREHVPAWFDLTPSLKPSGDALRVLDEIHTLAALNQAEPIVSAAYSAAAVSAAVSAAHSAAHSAAVSAAVSAAHSAAHSAAYSAARSAAVSVAYSALKPTTERLQVSAVELVRRMCAVTA